MNCQQRGTSAPLPGGKTSEAVMGIVKALAVALQSRVQHDRDQHDAHDELSRHHLSSYMKDSAMASPK
jgi:hypothetical protein